MLSVPYSILCVYMWIRREDIKRFDDVQKKLLLQVLCVCFPTLFAAIVYAFVEFVAVPHSLVIVVNIFWQLSHGLHGLVYLAFNSNVRREVRALFIKPRTSSVVASTSPAVRGSTSKTDI
ncbi:hypothetical protein OESDEN_16482 [Oesophagostomum dentatum]|uniref:Uncharacterized protein n=1 Tax=Oesophagostomum dentatum TaxID=61180 RepID=A0A0B1SFV6_OESDE|nr:hypothetical protein OESDEN_16482 [Oesophagostomum dentatum]